MATSIKISQLPAKGSNLEATDLLEVSEFNGTGYVSKSITGAEIVASIPPTSVEWGDIGGTLSAQTDLNTALSGKVPTSRTLTINGTTQDLSADRTFTISTGITIGTTAITSGTVGRVLFEGTGNVVQESANLFWDNTNARLGIGSATPLTALSVNSLRPTISIRDTTGSTNSSYFGSFDDFLQIAVNRNPSTGVFTNTGKASAQISIEGSTSSGKIFFYATNTNGATPLEAMRINGTGNLLINTTTDAGFKLDVNGTAIFRSNITLNSNALYIGTNSAMQLYTASSDIYLSNGNTSRKIIFDLTGSGQFQFNNGNVLVGTTSNIASSKLTIESTTQGFLPPRMTTTQKNAIASPATGLMVYDTTLNLISVYNGTTWITL